MNPEDKFIRNEKIMPKPPLQTIIKHVACPWCGILVLADPDNYVEHVRDCREERGKAG